MADTKNLTTHASGHVFIAASLDGFIARCDGDVQWLDKFVGPEDDHGYDTFMAAMDGIVMGRGTFEKAITFPDWPFEKTTVVLSKSLSPSDVPAAIAHKVRISQLPPTELMKELRSQGWQRAYVDGGRVIQSFLNDNLIADLILTRAPVLLGEGIPLFGPSKREQDLEHIATTAFPSGLVQSTYRVTAYPGARG